MKTMFHGGGEGGGLRIVFDACIDGGGWPGPVPEAGATFGASWLGPNGFLARLETELGLGGTFASATERAAELARRLAHHDGPWARSFAADPLGTSRRLLADRDTLVLWGWRGEPVSPRLAALWHATEEASPGLPDRLIAISTALRARSVDVAHIEVRSPVRSLAPGWAEVLSRLAQRGVVVEEAPLPLGAAPGDLGEARAALLARDPRAKGAPGWVPQGDGRLTLLRPHGCLAAADEVAASLAALDSLAGVLVVGADAVLDASLARHGLPRVGAATAPPASTAAVRLVLEAAFEPMDPADLHALLCLDPGPVPRKVAWRLVHALRAFPGRGAPGWREALRDGLADIEEDRRPALAERLEAMLTPAAPRAGRLATRELARRLHVLASWARGRAEADPDGAGTLWSVVRLASTMQATVERLGVPELAHVELERLHGEVTQGSAAVPGEAGLAGVPGPGAVLGPADVVVWWGFTRDRAPAPPRFRLSRAERTALATAGVTPPDAGALMEAEAMAWRRPLERASRALVLVCPQTGERGEACFPHPLWDELIGAMGHARHGSLLEARQLRLPAPARRTRVEGRPLPAATPAARVSRAIAIRDAESPSSLEKLLGCSLAWTLGYHGDLKEGLSSPPDAPSPRLYGTICHHLLAAVFENGALGAAEAAARAEHLVDRDLHRLCENLALPRYQVQRAMVRQVIVESARALGELLTRTGATVRGVELDVSGTLAGVKVRGRADLVLAAPDVVLDLKWSGKGNEEKLKRGAALQLALYAELLRRDRTRPAIGYFVLGTQRLLAEADSPLPGARRVEGPRAEETLRGVEPALARRLDELGRGELVAPGASGDDVADELADGVLVIGPACKYCALTVCCGRGRCA